MENTFVADIQFFRGNDKDIIVKSFSFCKLFDDDIVQHFIFKPPFELGKLNLMRRREAVNVTLNYHHLNWDDGLIDYNLAVKIIQSALSDASEIFVKGLEKEKYLNSILSKKTCYNIEHLDCPNFKTMKASLLLQNPCSPVSSLNVIVMKKWLCELFKNTLTLANDSIGKFNEYGFFSMSARDLYFLPVKFLIHSLRAVFLQNHTNKFAPHIVYDPYFKDYINQDSGYDTVN